MRNKRNNTPPEVNLTIDEVSDDQIFAFVKGEIRETVSGILPTLKADFICETDKFPLHLTELNMTLTVREQEWRLVGTLDNFKFIENVVSLYITLVPRDFYILPQSAKFLSVSDVIDTLYPGEVETDIIDNLPREINQVGTTDYKILNNVLRGMKAPSVFSYNINKLVIRDLSDPRIDFEVNPDRTPYYIHDRMKDYSFSKGGYVPANRYVVMDKDREKETSLIEYNAMRVTYNSEFDDMIENIISNTKQLKQNRLLLRVVFQNVMEFQCGNIIRIDLPNIDHTKYLVTERLGYIGKEIKMTYLLREV